MTTIRVCLLLSTPAWRGGRPVTDGDAGDVLPAAAPTDNLDGMGLDDGHFLWPLGAAVAVDGDFACWEFRAGAVPGFLSGVVVGV